MSQEPWRCRACTGVDGYHFPDCARRSEREPDGETEHGDRVYLYDPPEPSEPDRRCKCGHSRDRHYTPDADPDYYGLCLNGGCECNRYEADRPELDDDVEPETCMCDHCWQLKDRLQAAEERVEELEEKRNYYQAAFAEEREVCGERGARVQELQSRLLHVRQRRQEVEEELDESQAQHAEYRAAIDRAMGQNADLLELAEKLETQRDECREKLREARRMAKAVDLRFAGGNPKGAQVAARRLRVFLDGGSEDDRSVDECGDPIKQVSAKDQDSKDHAGGLDES